MKRLQILTFQFLLLSLLASMTACQESRTGPGWELTPPATDADPVSATEQSVGIYPAGSRLPDKKALGGFGPCDNFPHALGQKTWGENDTVSVVAFPEESCAYFQNRGIALRVINRSRKDVPFDASDSSLRSEEHTSELQSL